MTHFALAVHVIVLITALRTPQSAVAVTYSVPASVSLHEPVVITVTIQNLLRETVNLDLGWNRREGFALALRGSDGKVQRLKIAPSGVGRIGRISIASNAMYSQQLVLDDWISFDRPGEYQVVIRLTAPITGVGSGIAGPPADTLNIRIGPYNEAILREKCEQLARSVTYVDVEERYNALQLLRHMKDPAEIPCLRSVLDNTEIADSIVIEALRRIGTLDARRVLEDVAANSSGDRAEMARNAMLLLKQP